MLSYGGVYRGGRPWATAKPPVLLVSRRAGARTPSSERRIRTTARPWPRLAWPIRTLHEPSSARSRPSPPWKDVGPPHPAARENPDTIPRRSVRGRTRRTQPMRFERLGAHKAHRRDLGGFQQNRRRALRLEGFPPTSGAQAPAVPGLQTRKAVPRCGRLEVIAAALRKAEKLSRHLGTYDVGSAIGGPGGAKTISIEPRERLLGTLLKRLGIDVQDSPGWTGLGLVGSGGIRGLRPDLPKKRERRTERSGAHKKEMLHKISQTLNPPAPCLSGRLRALRAPRRQALTGNPANPRKRPEPPGPFAKAPRATTDPPAADGRARIVRPGAASRPAPPACPRPRGPAPPARSRRAKPD